MRKFYEIIEEESIPATIRVMNLLDFCDQLGFNEPDYFPVISLTNTTSGTGITLGHAFVLSEYNRYEDELILSTIDSAAEDGERMIRCPILTRNGQQKLVIGGKFDQLCLGSDKCYHICFN